TKRPRRCGWMDLVALRYAVMLSGVTRIIMTKADVLDSFDQIKAATGYEISGNETSEFPFDVCEADIKPIYHSFTGWKDAPISKCTAPEQLPQSFREFCIFIEKF